MTTTTLDLRKKLRQSWFNMVEKLTNVKNPKYQDYKRFVFEDSWTDFENFYTDLEPMCLAFMTLRPNQEFRIARINKSGNFVLSNFYCEPLNTVKKPKEKTVSMDKETRATPNCKLAYYARKHKIKYGTLYYRHVRLGEPLDKVLTELGVIAETPQYTTYPKVDSNLTLTKTLTPLPTKPLPESNRQAIEVFNVKEATNTPVRSKKEVCRLCRYIFFVEPSQIGMFVSDDNTVKMTVLVCPKCNQISKIIDNQEGLDIFNSKRGQ